MQDIAVRSATDDDLEFIRDVLANNNLPVADVKKHLDGFYRFESGDDTVGIGALQPANGDALLRSFVILEHQRGRGFGTRCCEELIQIAEEQSIQRLYLLTTDAAGFFSRLGFARIERSQVPLAIRNTRQFSDLCPASATCMRFTL